MNKPAYVCPCDMEAERITGNISLVLEVEMYKAEVEETCSASFCAVLQELFHTQMCMQPLGSFKI